MKKLLILFFTIIFVLVSFQSVDAANLLFNTSFENAVLTQMTATEICMNLPYSNVGIITSGSGEMWVEDGSQMPTGTFPHSGTKCIGGRTMAVASGSPRAEYELTHLDGVNPWCAPQALDISALSDVYVSVWIYLPPNYGFSKATYHEIINPFVFYDAEMSPRTSFHIHQESDGTFNLWLEYDYRKAGAAGLSYKLWWVLADPFNISDIRGKWTKWSYFLHHSNNPDEAYMQAWLNDVPFTATPRDPTNPRFTDFNCLDILCKDTWQTDGCSLAARDAYWATTGQSGSFHFVTTPESAPNWFLCYSKMYHDADSQEHLMWADDLEVWDGIPTTTTTTTITSTTSTTTTTTTLPGQVTISGILRNNTKTIEGNISIYNPGSNRINTSQITSGGTYGLPVFPGIYDLQYNIYHISNFFIKLISVNIASNIQNIVSYVNKISNGLSFVADITGNQEIQVYSDKIPNRILKNGTLLENVDSYSQLTNNKWYYNSSEKKLYILINPTVITTTTTTTVSTTTTSSTTTIPISAKYTITGVNGAYTGIENISPYRTTSGSNAATVIKTVFGWMSSGQSVEFIGDFTIDSTITVTKNIFMDWTQATVTSTVTYPLIVRAAVTILGGHWIGTGTQTNMAIQFWTGSANSIVDGIDAENFLLEMAWGATLITVQNCYFHDTTNSYFLIINGYQGYITVKNCRFLRSARGAVFVNDAAPHNQFIGCEFGYIQRSHAIYFDGGEGSIGSNIVTGCTFHDQYAQAGLHIKCNNNKIYNNSFYNFTSSVGLSIYSEYSPSYANDNEIYNNTFTDMVEAFWLGHDPANYPTLRNKIHDNIFTRVTNCIRLNPWAGAINTTEDTWIYYNRFTSCANPFPPTESPNSPLLIKNTVIAYNTFDTPVPANEVVALKSYNNTMIYNNTGMENYNVPDPLPIPPPP